MMYLTAEGNSPPSAAVVDGPRAGERGHQQDAGRLHPEEESQAPHGVCGPTA